MFIQENRLLNIPKALFKYGETRHFAGDTFFLLPTSQANKPHPLSVVPATTTFEPQLLPSSGVSLNQRSSADGPNNDPGKSHQTAKEQTSARLKGGILLSSLFLLFSLLFLADTGDGINPMFWIFPTHFVAFCLYFLYSYKTNKFIIPGGLLIQKARFRQKKWTLLRFDRRECVTFISMNEKRGSFSIHIMDTNTRNRVKLALPKQTFDRFLSAWLSPLPTPTLEEMSDFA